MRHLVAFALLVTSGYLSGCCSDSGGEGDAGLSRRTDAATRRDGGPRQDLDGGPSDTGVVARGPTNGGPVVVSSDGRLAITANRLTGRTQGSNLEKFQLNLGTLPPTMTASGSLAFAEVSQLILSPDEESAYAAGSTGVSKLVRLRQGATLVPQRRAAAGSEPRGIALSPSGAILYVASWGDGTVTAFDTATMAPSETIDLNEALVASGLLGEGLSTRPGFAHPYAIAVTDDGDDDDQDEHVYVTEYFSQARASGVPDDDSAFDLGRQGVVYRFDTGPTRNVTVLSIAPRTLGSPAFNDSNGDPTGCFPNLLSVATYHAGRVYVAGTCASPRGPIGPTISGATGEILSTSNVRTVMHPGIYVLDAATGAEIPEASVLLSRAFLDRYVADGVPDTEARRFPHLISGLAFRPGTDVAYASAYGADALFRIEWSAGGVSVGARGRPFIDLAPPDGQPGHLPIGLSITRDGRYAIVVNEHTRNVSFVDLDQEMLVGAADMSGTHPIGDEAAINDGRRAFVTGVGRWSYRGQAWSSCEGCHPGGLSDGVTWFFPRGPRQTIALDGAFSSISAAQVRIFGWTAHLDEVSDFELTARDLAGGVGAIVHQDSNPPVLEDRIVFDFSRTLPQGATVTDRSHAGLDGSTESLLPNGSGPLRSVVGDWDSILAYVQSIRTPRAPSTLDAASVIAGRTLFSQALCSTCHATEMWTISRRFYTPSEATNDLSTGSLQRTSYVANANFPAALNPPTAGAGRSAPLRFLDPADDQLSCALRAVGTFPAALDGARTGVAPPGVRVREVRADMQTPAQGATGYNIPSLLGVGYGAPYFHAGNARTLEELLSATFAAHRDAVPPGLAGATDPVTLRNLISFLLSIDERSAMSSTPPLGQLGFDPRLCPMSL